MCVSVIVFSCAFVYVRISEAHSVIYKVIEYSGRTYTSQIECQNTLIEQSVILFGLSWLRYKVLLYFVLDLYACAIPVVWTAAIITMQYNIVCILK